MSVAMNALEIAGPSVSGCDRFSSTCTRPITVPMMPMVGAKPPALSNGSTLWRWRAVMPSISASRISRTRSGSVPSTTSCSPFLRYSSSMPSISSSRASRPSRRARSAKRTSSTTLPPRSASSPARTFLYSAGIFFMASMPHEAMQTPPVPAKMISSADGWMKAVGMVPSITAPARRPKMASPIPMAVAAFMGVHWGDRRLAADLHRAASPLDLLVWWNAPARMPARHSRTAATTASTLSVTTTFVPVVSATCVSGVASTVTIRSGLRMKGALSAPRRCSSIMVFLSSQVRSGLVVHVDQVLEHLVRGGDDPGVGLEATLGGDEAGELAGHVDVGHLQRTRGGHAERAGLAGGADALDAGVDARAPLVARQALEALLVGELGQRDEAG